MDLNMDLLTIGRQAKEASGYMNRMGITEKNQGLLLTAQSLLDHEDEILTANVQDIENAEKNGMSPSMIDRLSLDHNRLEGMAD